MKKTEFITTDFENSHGKKPHGIGFWVFGTTRDFKDAKGFSGNFSEAKRQAIKFFNNPKTIFVFA